MSGNQTKERLVFTSGNQTQERFVFTSGNHTQETFINDFYNQKNKDDIKDGNDNLSEVAYSEVVNLSEAPDRLTTSRSVKEESLAL